ncbi:diacylglycerol lipase-alpha [Stomoxys calcitrans]|uniref:diacylglycerol lipase-alpha n=1 Tax=Stomoxys calcitrans TaxID=35570 RepID=UPI0027E27D52|nr:diacylglycerol lipase-alpha [Stomoxys calcitrans]
MPGLVAFRRRWLIASDDLVVPGAFLVTIHLICLVTLTVSIAKFEYDRNILDTKLLLYHQRVSLAILLVSLCIEMAICVISMRGTIMETNARASINFWIYSKTALMVFDISWLVLGTIWLFKFYTESSIGKPKQLFLSTIIAGWSLVFLLFIIVSRSLDTVGKTWAKLEKEKKSMDVIESHCGGNGFTIVNDNWRQRKVMRAYEDRWVQFTRSLFRLVGSSEQKNNYINDVARMTSDLYCGNDIVPSDVIAGFLVLRKFQQLQREAAVRQRKNGTLEFLSGIPITEHTQFMEINDANNSDFFQAIYRYMQFAAAVYGCRMYCQDNPSKICSLVPDLKCCGRCSASAVPEAEVFEDNCCYGNYAAVKKTLPIDGIEIVYASFHVDVGEIPFFIAIDYTRKKIVISIRGTWDLRDFLISFNFWPEVIPLNPPRDDWLGAKGFVKAAVYIKNQLEEKSLLQMAFNKNTERNTHTFELLVVGHSMGAGVATILAILLKPSYPSLQSINYSSPGSLLSMAAMEYSKTFITTICMGKDFYIHLGGQYQISLLCADVENALQHSIDPKWKTILCPNAKSFAEVYGNDIELNKYQQARMKARSRITYQPMYPPGRILHIVRQHSKDTKKSRKPVFRAIWTNNTDYAETPVSPVLVPDHMPKNLMSALKKIACNAEKCRVEPKSDSS